MAVTFFQFPSRCSRCGSAAAPHRWTIGQEKSVGDYGILRQTDVPVCATCLAVLIRHGRVRRGVAFGAGVVAALLVWAGLAFWSRLDAAGWLAVAVNGVVAALFAGSVAYDPVLMRFAEYSPSGGTILFADDEYQRDFDRANGRPTLPKPPPVTLTQTAPLKERWVALVLGLGFLLIAVFLAVIFVRFLPEFFALSIGPLAVVAILSFTVVLYGLGVVRGAWLQRWVTPSLREEPAGADTVEAAIKEAESLLGRKMTFFEKPSPTLSPAVGWCVLLGFLAAMLGLVAWLATRE
jgi:hypothetical protein